MRGSTYNELMLACAVVMTICTVISTATVIWQQVSGVPANWFTYIAMFLAGFGFGFSIRHFASGRAGRKAVEEGFGRWERAIADAEPDWERVVADRLKAMDFEAKELVCQAYDQGGIVLDRNLDDDRRPWARQAAALLDRETLLRGRHRYTLKPEAKRAFDARPDLLAPAREPGAADARPEPVEDME